MFPLRRRQAGRPLVRRAALLTLLTVVAAVGGASAYAAFSNSTTNSTNSFDTGSVFIRDNDEGQAMLSLDSAPLGTSDTSCIKVTYDGDLDAQVRHHATVSGDLAQYLTLKITRGTGAETFDNCGDFNADLTNYFGKGAGVIYDGKLSDYPTSYAAGIVDPGAGSVSSYSSIIQNTAGLVSYWRLGDESISADEFTDTSGTVLSSHTGQLAATWASLPSQARTAVITDENRLRKETGDGGATYYSSAVPSSANYQVEADVHVKSLLGTDAVGVIGRASTDAETFYLARYWVDTAQWDLFRVVNGTGTAIGSAAQTLTAGNTYRVTLDMNGSTIRLLVNGTQLISVADTGISQVGRGGVRLGTGASTAQPTNSTGLHIDNFRVTGRGTTAVDSKGTNNGTYVGGVLLNQPGISQAGSDNRAAFWDNTNDHVTIPDANSLDLGDVLTLEAWIKRSGTTDDSIIEKGGGAYELWITGNRLTMRKPGTADIVQSTTTITDTNWHHVVATKNGATTKLYIDGVDRTGTVTNQTLANSTSALLFGEDARFGGTIDEIAIYNVALSEADVQSHYNAGTTTTTDETWTTGESHAYKFQITLDNNSLAAGKSGSATFHWEARNL